MKLRHMIVFSLLAIGLNAHLSNADSGCGHVNILFKGNERAQVYRFSAQCDKGSSFDVDENGHLNVGLVDADHYAVYTTDASNGITDIEVTEDNPNWRVYESSTGLVIRFNKEHPSKSIVTTNGHDCSN